MVPLSIASFIEVSMGCICASLATLRPFIQKFIIRSRRGNTFRPGTGPDGSEFSSTYNSAAQKSWNLQEIHEVDEESSTRSNSKATV
jgi:hypothetical protein